MSMMLKALGNHCEAFTDEELSAAMMLIGFEFLIRYGSSAESNMKSVIDACLEQIAASREE